MVRRCLPHLCLLLSVVCLAGGPAFGEEPPKALTPAQAADAVLKAVEAKDDAALKALAGKDNPDPWLVADALCDRDAYDAAEAFAKASPRTAIEKLPAYIAAMREKPTGAARRGLLPQVNAALGTGDDQKALDVLGPPTDGAIEDVVGVRLEHGRGIALDGLRRLPAAFAAYFRSADAAERMGWLRRAIEGFNQAGSAGFRGGEYAAAREALERQLALHGRLGDEDGVATVTGNLGLIHSATGDLTKAIELYERSLAAKRSSGDRASIALTLGNIATVHYDMGNYAKSLSTAQRALSLMRELEDKHGVARVLGSLGNTYSQLGEHAKALDHLEQSYERLEALGDRRLAANMLSDLARAHHTLGNHEKALSLYERALPMHEAVGNRAGAARTLGNIGTVHYSLENLDQALETGLAALAAKEALGDRLGAAMTLNNIGNVHQALGDWAAALDYRQRALAALQEIGDRVNAMVVTRNIGRLYLDQGEFEKARDLLRKGVRAARSLRAVPVLVRTLSDLALVYLELDQPGRALATAQQALMEAETLFGGLGEEAGAVAREHHSSLFVIGAVAASLEDDPAEALVFLESGRAGALLDMLDKRETLRWKAESLPATLREAEEDAEAGLRAARRAYNRASSSGGRKERKAAARGLDAAEAGLRQVVARIQRELKQQADLFYPRPKTIDEIQSALASHQALVLYGLGLRRAMALVVRPDAARIVSLGSDATVSEAVRALDATDLDTDPTAALDTLRKLLVEPLKLESAVTQVIVSPVGSLGHVPFGALFEQSVGMTPSGTTHALLRSEHRALGTGVLGLGAPDYAGTEVQTGPVLHRGAPLVPLPATREEVDAVATTRLVGARANETAFRKALGASERWRAVHFACHGLVDAERPMSSSLALSRTATDDGFLTALEILRMEIPADLTVLSACETARGKILRGEGIVGLTRAFMFAGSPRVLCSLWKVDDEATKALMVKFYELWNPKAGEGLGAAEALKRAQAYVRAQDRWKHPYYWAAWVLWGLPD